MRKIRLFHSVTIPDELKLARYRKLPDLGPKILFFSGGTALNSLSKALVRYTHNSFHLVTPFDSGGSSAIIRKAFKMLAVGDMRSRLMALADQSVKGNPEIFRLFAYRLPKDRTDDQLKNELSLMAHGKHARISSIPDPMRTIIRSHLTYFIKKMPADFDLRGASIGNLVLTAGFFTNNRHIDPVIFIFSKLIEARGTVRPIMNCHLHLMARLKDDTLVRGQHMLTGKETPPVTSPVTDVFLSKSLDHPVPVKPLIKDKVKRMILDSELICYPMGSFYSSIIANLLPQGVGSAIADNLCPKIFIPNTGFDPEQEGTSLDQRVEILLSYLHKSCLESRPDHNLLNYVLLDPDHSLYQGGVSPEKIKSMGVNILELPLTQSTQKPYLNNQLLVETLLSML
ncbi:MAG: GAK system CofD-like protein [Desulfonatronovibrio sp.]